MRTMGRGEKDGGGHRKPSQDIASPPLEQRWRRKTKEQKGESSEVAGRRQDILDILY